MILGLLAIFFFWMVLRELFNKERPFAKYDSFDVGYLAVLIFLTYLCARSPVKLWMFEKMLSEKASVLAQRADVDVRCTSVFDSIFDRYDMVRAGSAYPSTGEIVFHHGWCQQFMAYLDHPENVTDDELFSMHVFTHEVMHIKGEMNERKADCQAVQRNLQAGVLLGVEPSLARKNALSFYQNLYPKHPYFDKQCGPNKALDERLPNTIW